MPQCFDLFDHKLVFEYNFLVDVLIRTEIIGYANNAKQEYIKRHRSELHSIEDLLEQAATIALGIFVEMAKNCEELVRDAEVENFSTATLIAPLSHGYFFALLEDMENWYISIQETEAAKDAYRKARRKNRTRWFSMAFDPTSAIAGSIKAGTMNLASGVLHGTANLIGKSFSSAGTAISKSAMFHDKNTLDKLSTAIYVDIYNWIYLIEDIIADKTGNIRPITLEEEALSVKLFNELKNPSKELSKKQLYDTAATLFQTNPSEPEFYDYCFCTFPEQQKNLICLAEFCEIDLSHLCEAFLEKIYKSSPRKTEDDFLELEKALFNKMQEFGLPNSSIYEEVKNQLHKFDIDAKTYRGILFSSRTLRNKAEEDDNALALMCGKVDSLTSAQCESLLAVIDEKYVQEIRQIYLTKLNAQIWWLEYKDHKAAFEKLYNKEAQNDSKLRAAKSWWKFPTLLSIALFASFLTALLGLHDETWIPELLIPATFFFWIACAVRKDSLLKKNLSADALKEQEQMDFAWEKYKELRNLFEPE